MSRNAPDCDGLAHRQLSLYDVLRNKLRKINWEYVGTATVFSAQQRFTATLDNKERISTPLSDRENFVNHHA